MADLLTRLDLPDGFHDWPQQAQDSHWNNDVHLEQLTNALVEEYDLPQSGGIPYLNKQQMIALVRELDSGVDA